MGERELPQVIDIESLLAPHPPRTNFNLFWIDDAYTMRVATVDDAFPWHYHPQSDEGWLVLRGRLRIRTEIGDVELSKGQSTVIRSPLRHSPLALEHGTQVLIVNSRSFTTVYTERGVDDTAARYRELDVEGTL
jgi:mannose-6-phosphate isomerase-like protein (cupin superfamily)